VSGMDHSIGALARLGGVSVKTVRHYSELGLLASYRTSAGHRRYDESAVARLRLIRTLRALDLDLPTISAVLRDERTLAEVAATHADAVAIQLRTLQRQHALLTVLAQHPDLEDLYLMTDQTEQERRALIADFLDTTVGDTTHAIRQNLTPELPDNPTATQLEARTHHTSHLGRLPYVGTPDGSRLPGPGRRQPAPTRPRVPGAPARAPRNRGRPSLVSLPRTTCRDQRVGAAVTDYGVAARSSRGGSRSAGS
jgi:DNA-binding transcriptional MerR regulator